MWNITETFLVKLRLILQSPCAEPLYLPVTWSWPLTLLFLLENNLPHTQHLLLDLKLYSSSLVMIDFHESFFYHQFTIPILLKNCFNKLIDFILSSVKNNWSPKFVKNTQDFKSKTAKKMFLILLVQGAMLPLSSFSNPLKTDSSQYIL